MKTKPLLIVLALSVAPAARAAAPSEGAGWTGSKARRALHEGLEAELVKNDDAKAQKLWEACLTAAVPDSDEAGDCRIYADMFGASRPDPKKDAPAAKKSFAAGIAAHLKGDDATASARWHDCVGQSEAATLVRNRCMAALDLIPAKPTPPAAANDAAARKIYLEGLTRYMLGDFAATRAAWTSCVAKADPAGKTMGDCRAGLAKLDRDAAKAAR